MALGGVGVAGAAVIGVWAFNMAPGNALVRTDRVSLESDGAFRPSDTQWSSLRFATVGQVAFRDEHATDGRIAIDEDTATPVFSPWSGRVSRLIARPGDHVERGAPLFAVEASELVHGHNAEGVVGAPIAGTIIQRRIGLGQSVNAGAADPAFTVGNLSTVWLVANVRESEAPRMKVGAPIKVTVLAFPGQVYDARLNYVAPVLDANTRRLPVRAEIQNAHRELLPEMFASFRIASGEERSVPAVPADAIVYEGAQARVWVARPGDKTVVSREIATGDTVNGLVEVRKGLAAGESVVTSGTLFIDRAAQRN